MAPDAQWTLGPADLASRSSNTPLRGHQMHGRVMLTVADGQVTYAHGVS